MGLQSKEAAAAAVKAAYSAIEDKLGFDIKILDIEHISVMADFFIIASAKNQNQLKAIADYAEEKVYKTGIPLRHSEGYQNTKWILLDFGCVIIHIFTAEEREFYNLERIWKDAKEVLPEDL